jgi:hypothetical protein
MDTLVLGLVCLFKGVISIFLTVAVGGLVSVLKTNILALLVIHATRGPSSFSLCTGEGKVIGARARDPSDLNMWRLASLQASSTSSPPDIQPAMGEVNSASQSKGESSLAWADILWRLPPVKVA